MVQQKRIRLGAMRLYKPHKNEEIFHEDSFFFFFNFLASPVACGSSQARDQTHGTAST